MALRRRLRSAVVFLAMFTVPAVARAQVVPDNFEQLRFVLAPGSDIRVVETNGQTVAGTFVGFSGSSLDLLVDGARRLVAEEDVLRIRQRKDDSLSNGARNGFITGLGLGLLAGLALRSEGGAALIPFSMVVYGGMGAGVGVGIDALIRGQRTVYEAPGSRRSSISVVPVVARERKGVAVRLGF